MPAEVFFAVLFAAALHAGWNAVVKVGLDPLLSMTLVSASATVAAAAILPFFAPPPVEAWPFLAASVALHTGYKVFLVRAYQSGDLGQVYPIARGTGPLLVAVFGLLVLGETMGVAPAVGVAVLLGGVWLMAVRGSRGRLAIGRTAVLYALLTACFIAGYTVTDGLGARTAGVAHGYALTLFLFDGLVMLGVCLWMRGPRALAAMMPVLPAGFAGGLMSLGAYWIAIWAMTRAPLASVAALRETSILFAILFSVLFLREPATRWRAAAGVLIAAGAVILRVS